MEVGALQPEIHYATTADGVRIAYYTRGQGPPLVRVRVMFSHLTAELTLGIEAPGWRDASRISTVVRYDHRGFGLSDRAAPDFSLDAMCLDLEAVVASLGLRRFYIVADLVHGSLIAINYANRHPEQVVRMALYSAATRIPADWHDRASQLLKTFRGDWRSFTESFAQYVRGWERQEDAKRSAAFLRASVEMDAFKSIWREMGKWDVTALLPQVTTPTLLLYGRDSPRFGPQHGRELASVMPDARVVVVERSDPGEYAGPAEVQAIRSFFGAPDVGSGTMPESATSETGMTAILFADIADSTALTERLGDAAFRAKARDLDAALRTVIREHAGTAIEGKLLGDGVLAVFTSARQAIEAALACATEREGAGLPLHLGLHAGDVIREDNNVYGGAVNIASRISGLSAPGEVLVSETVRSLARTSAGVRFEDRGEQSLKGVGEPVRVWAVREAV